MNNSSKNNKIWMAVFCVTPGIFFMKAKAFFEVDIVSRIAIGTLLGSIGLFIGFLIWRLVRNRPVQHKIVAVSVMTVALIFTVITISSAKANRLHTCEVCGYKAVKTEEHNCSLCGSHVWDKLDKDDLQTLSKNEWLKEEQLFMFTLDSANQSIDFHLTENEDGYEKDLSWKPVITEQDLKNELTEKSRLRK